jgi:2-dehydro-3-deoxyphosphogalactonate aldolase
MKIRLKACILILFALIFGHFGYAVQNNLTKLASSHLAPTIIPILHDIPHDPGNLDLIASAIASYSYSSVSLRTPTSLESFSYLRSKLNSLGSSCILGASTVVSKSQVDYVKSHDAGFISTTFLSPSLVAYAHNHGVSVLCGVSSALEAIDAIKQNVQALKFYPSSKVSPQELKGILQSIQEKCLLRDDLPITVAGGVLPEHLPPYRLAGTHSFAIGVSCAHIESAAQLQAKLEPYISNAMKRHV